MDPRTILTLKSHTNKKGKRKVQGVPQSQTAALPRPQEEEETDKCKQAQTEQTYEKHVNTTQFLTEKCKRRSRADVNNLFLNRGPLIQKLLC